MSTIRNLSVAPSYGANDSERGGRRRALSYTFDGDVTSATPSLTSRTLSHLTHRRDRHHNNLAGEVFGPSVLQPSQSFPYRPRIPSNSIVSTIGEVPPPMTKVPSPPIGGGGGGMFRKLRSSTWDSAGMHQSSMNPTSMLIRSSSVGTDHKLFSQESNVISDNSIHSVQRDGRMGENLNDLTTVGMIDDSLSEHSSEVEEGTAREKIHASLHSSVDDDIQQEERYLVPTSHDNDVSFTTDQAVDMNDLVNAKSVTFSEDVSVLQDNGLRPRLVQLESSNGDEERVDVLASTYSHPVAHASNRDNPFTREKSHLNPFHNVSSSLISSCIVRYAPCFLCSKKLGTSPTDREILLRLNLICIFFCATQFIIGILLFVFRYTGYMKDIEDAKKSGTDEELIIQPFVSVDLWSLQTFVYTLSLLSAVLGIGSMLAQRSIREVNLVGSVRWMWCLFWLLPIQIFFMIGLFDYYSVNAVHTRHWWGDPSMRTSRELFCYPGTANAQCKVPILGGVDYPSEKKWCLDKFFATNCTEIRDSAQRKYVVSSQIFYTSIGIWACCFALLLWLILCILQAIITLPIVQRSKESNIPLWLTFPIIGCYTIGYLLFSSQTALTYELQDVYWIALVYLLSGGAFSLAALVGYFLKFYTVFNRRQRRFKQGVVVLFIATIMLTIFTVATIFATSLIYALNIVDLPLEQYSLLACYLDSDGSCTGCEQEDPLLMCPEWTKDDVRKVLETIMKQSATLAAIFLVYALITLRYGFVLFRHVSRYQIEFV